MDAFARLVLALMILWFEADTLGQNTNIVLLPIAQTVAGDLVRSGDFDVYRFDAQPGDSVLFQLKGDGPNDANELYVKFGSVPTLAQYDFTAQIAGQPRQILEFPATKAGSYFVMAYARTDSSSAVEIVSPLDRTLFGLGNQIFIVANSHPAPGSAIQRVEFYVQTPPLDKELLGTSVSSTASFTFSWDHAALGSYLLTAKAIDNHGLSAISQPIRYFHYFDDACIM